MTHVVHYPPDPEYAERVNNSFKCQPFMDYIGARLIAIAPGRCELLLPRRPELTQQFGYFHAGIISTMADNAGGYAALSLMPPGKDVLSVEFKLNLLNPGKGEALISRGSVIKSGRTLTVCRVDVFDVNEGKETLAATALLTIISVDAPPKSDCR